MRRESYVSFPFFCIVTLMTVCALTPRAWGRDWQISEIGSAGDFQSLKLDASDKPHIAYRARNGTVDTLTYTYFDGSSWHSEAVDSSGKAGAYCSMALDSSGFAHISYYDTAGEDLKYAYWNGSSWNTQTIDSQGHVGGLTSIALDGNDKSHISYIDWSEGCVGYAHQGPSGWVTESIYSLYGRTSIALDSSGNPSIVSDNKYASWDGMSWNVMTFDDSAINSDVSLALDGGNNPHIAYHDITINVLKYAVWNDSSWDIQAVADLASGGSLDMALDSDELPYIAYTRSNLMRYATFNGVDWDIEQVGGGFPVSLELDSRGLAHLAYADLTTGNLMYAEELPEPATFFLLVLGAVVLKRKCR